MTVISRTTARLLPVDADGRFRELVEETGIVRLDHDVTIDFGGHQEDEA